MRLIISKILKQNMTQTGRLMQQVMIEHKCFCLECKKTEIFKGEDVRHCTFKAWHSGWSPTLCLCPNCYRVKR